MLSASAWIRDLQKYQYQGVIDLKPALSEEQLYARITRDFELLAGKNAANCLQKLVPSTMQPVLLERWGIDTEMRVNQIDRTKRLELVKLLKNFAVPIRARGDLEHAVITSGGVPVKEVAPRTMESKKAEKSVLCWRSVGLGCLHRGIQFADCLCYGYGSSKRLCGKFWSG